MKGKRRPKQWDFTGPRAGYFKKGGRNALQENSSAQFRHAACCRGADGCGYPLQGSTLERQQPSRGSGGNFPAEYPAKATTTGSLHLRAEMVAAEVAYTITNTQPSCSRGGESDRVMNIFKEAMSLPQAARWRTASDKEIASLRKHGVFNLVPITSVPLGHKVVDTSWVLKIKTDSTYEGRLVVQEFL